MAHLKFLDGLEVARQVTLNELDSNAFLNRVGYITNAMGLYKGVLLDLETTGLESTSDVILEVGLREFYFDQFYVFKGFGNFYNGFSDPGFPIPPEITKINGITNELVRGHALNWQRINEICDSSAIIIAHNAKFDCPFMKSHSFFTKKDIAWGCSMSQVPWEELGFLSQKLEILSVFHGFYYKGHRALIDADALGFLLSHKNYLSLLFTEAIREVVRVKVKPPWGKNDIVKSNGFKFDPIGKLWWKDVAYSELELTKKIIESLGDLNYCVLEKKTMFNKFYPK